MFFMAGMSKSTAWRVLHKFCEWFSLHMFETWIWLSRSDEELQQTMETYHRLGFTGAVGSTDVTHLSSVPWLTLGHIKARKASPLWRTGSPSTIPCVFRGQHVAFQAYAMIRRWSATATPLSRSG
ncbi:unnamed protein product [Discosporangium mesarthrocarpum]